MLQRLECPVVYAADQVVVQVQEPQLCVACKGVAVQTLYSVVTDTQSLLEGKWRMSTRLNGLVSRAIIPAFRGTHRCDRKEYSLLECDTMQSGISSTLLAVRLAVDPRY